MGKSIHWFRNDLRVEDNPALRDALARGTVLGLYVMEEGAQAAQRYHSGQAQKPELGGASKWWLHHSLQALDARLGGRLCIVRGDPLEAILNLAKQHDIDGVYWNRRYSDSDIVNDREVMSELRKAGLEVRSHNGSLLIEPWEVLKDDGSPYKVFTPYYRKVLQLLSARTEPTHSRVDGDFIDAGMSENKVSALGLLDKVYWYEEIEKLWIPGEDGAQRSLSRFLERGLASYKSGRDYPAQQSVSRLSPHLHFGELSPARLSQRVVDAGLEQSEEVQSEHFLRELIWRDFSYYLLYHFPHMDRMNLRTKFDGFPWRKDDDALRAWQLGMTGYPLVDAGMRELWQTGYMHNRVRMIVASFLVKNLMLHWHYGADWFWDCLLDADLASNSASWQWVAGSGTDASPYFRIFNPVIQGKKFDPDGAYILRFIPELATLPKKYLYAPYNAPAQVLQDCGIELGNHYPEPIVDLGLSRERALEAFKLLSSGEQQSG